MAGMTVRALIIRPHEILVKQIENTLYGWRTAIGDSNTYLENITLNADGLTMLVDEEGKFDSSNAPNYLATGLVNAFYPGWADQDLIVGNAMIIASQDSEGADCPQQVIDIVVEHARRLGMPVHND